MPSLVEGQFEIDGYTFGVGSDAVVVEDLDTGSRSFEDQDATIGWTGDVAFGRDIAGVPEWTFDLWVNSVPGRTALDAKNTFRAKWEGPMLTPGATSLLRYCVAGETWRLYGRPRRFSDLSTRDALAGGVGRLLASFKSASPLIFSDTEEMTTVATTGTATNAGAVATPATILFRGPATNPSLSGPGWSIALTATLGAQDTVTVYGRTATAETGAGANAATLLTRTSRMANLRLAVGANALTYAGGGDAVVKWRKARLTF